MKGCEHFKFKILFQIWAFDLKFLLKHPGKYNTGTIPPKSLLWINEVPGFTYGELTFTTVHNSRGSLDPWYIQSLARLHQ